MLYTKLDRPLVAKGDILCYKFLYPEEHKWSTPLMHMDIAFDEVLTPERMHRCKNKEIYTEDMLGDKVYACTEGFFHSYARCLDPMLPAYRHCECFLAIIPQGTEYYVSWDGNDILVASKRIIITEERADSTEISISLLQDIVENAPFMQGHMIGDFLLKNGSFVSYLEVKRRKQKIIGQVAGFTGQYLMVIPINDPIYSGEPLEETWVIPSLKEFSMFINNYIFLNATRILLNKGDIIGANGEKAYYTLGIKPDEPVTVAYYDSKGIVKPLPHTEYNNVHIMPFKRVWIE